VGHAAHDGDLVAELVERNATTGVVTIDDEPLTGATVLPSNWQLSATGDFNHDGKADLLWRNVTSQKLAVWLMDGPAKIGSIVPSPDQAVDANWGVAGAADLNGDGHRDLLWYNQTTGKIVAWYMDGAMVRLTGAFTNPPGVGNNNWKVVALSDYGRGGGPAGTHDIVWQNDTSLNVVVWHMDLAGNRTSGGFTNPFNPGPGYKVVAPR
jgi:hypothetical protein